MIPDTKYGDGMLQTLKNHFFNRGIVSVVGVMGMKMQVSEVKLRVVQRSVFREWRAPQAF